MTKTLDNPHKQKILNTLKEQTAKFRQTVENSFHSPFKAFEQKYINSASYRKALRLACGIEDNLENGMSINSGTVLLKGNFSDSDGHLRASFNVEHGQVFYTAHDEDIYKLTIETRPSNKFINNLEKLDEESINECIQRYSNRLYIDLRDTVTLRKAKEVFSDDYVLKNLPLNSGAGKVASRFVIWHIRAYRKAFYRYYIQAKSLWEGSGFKNARSLVGEFKRRGISEE
jgi:hypothetical protein